MSQDTPETGHMPDSPEEDTTDRYSRFYERLADSILGREIVISDYRGENPYAGEEQRKMGVSMTDQRQLTYHKLGHALSSNEDGSEMVILTPEGNVFIVQAHRTEDGNVNSEFKNLLHEGFLLSGDIKSVIELRFKQGKSLFNILNELKNLLGINRIIYPIDEKTEDYINERIQRSLSISQQRIENAQKAGKGTRDSATNMLEDLFHDNNTSTDTEHDDPGVS